MSSAKPVNQRAWWFVLPVLVSVAFSALIPLMTIVNYSVQDILGPDQAVFVGMEWYKEILRDPDLHGALYRQLVFTAAVLAIEIPLGIALALAMPERGWRASLALVLLAMPLLIPWNVVGTIWQIFARGDIGLLGYVLTQLGIDYNYSQHPTDAWVTVLVMDVWHWTPLVALLVVRRAARDSRAVLPGRAHRRRFALGGVSPHRAAEDARRADDRVAAAAHGQLHDLHRAVRADRRRPGHRDDVPVAVPHAEGGRPVRSRAGGGVLARVLPDHPAAVLRAVQLHEGRRT